MTQIVELPLTVLAWEGPQARAYLTRMRRAGLRARTIVLMVHDPRRTGRAASLAVSRPALLARAERAQDRSHNFHPYAIRRQHPELVERIGEAMSGIVRTPMALYDDMYSAFSYDEHADSVVRVAAASYKEPVLAGALRGAGAQTVLFTGGGIVPASLFELPGTRFVHVHTGYLPHVRGADVLLWSLLARGRPGVSAFFMTPGLDDGDVLAARELDPLEIRLPPGPRLDDDTLYRALFSFVDPLLRAELLVSDVLEPAATDLDALHGTPQDLSTGITYHFMHRVVRSRALHALYVAPPEQRTTGRVGDTVGRPSSYRKYYDKPSFLAPLRFTADARRASSPTRALSIENRRHDYPKLADKPELRALHRDLNIQLALQDELWDSYDYGEGYYYQSSAALGITGLRDTDARVASYGLRDLVRGRTVLEIGCNSGFLSLAIAPDATRVLGFEINPYLIAIAERAAQFLAVTNVDFVACAFEDLSTGEQFDDVLSFANHHTYDGNTRQSLEEYFARCHAHTRPGGRLIFESHPPELEGNGFGRTRAIIERYYDLTRDEVHQFGTHLDAGRRFLVGTRRDEVHA